MFPGATAKALMGALSRLGVDHAKLKRAVGPMAERLPDASFSRLWRVANQCLGGDSLELDIAEAMQVGALGPLDVLILSAPTVGDACTLAGAHLGWLLGSGVRLEATSLGNGDVQLTLLNASPHEADSSDALFFGVLVNALRGRTAGAFSLRAVRLTRARPVSAARWNSFFCGTVRFGAPVSSLVFPAEVWRTDMVSSSEVVHRALSPLVPTGDSLESAVRASAQHALATASLESLARAMGLSKRTLQRRLKAERVSMRALLVEERLLVARRLLTKPGATRKAVAAAVGYRSASAMTRALRGK